MGSQKVGHDWATFTFTFTLGFPDSSVVKESTCSARDPCSIPGSGRSTGEGIGYPLQYSWASLVAQLVKNLPAMQETWVWSLVGKIPWGRERLPIPVFWPGEFHELYSPWGRKESDTTEGLSLHFQMVGHFQTPYVPLLTPFSCFTLVILRLQRKKKFLTFLKYK